MLKDKCLTRKKSEVLDEIFLQEFGKKLEEMLHEIKSEPVAAAIAEACHSLFPLIKGHTTTKIYSDFGIFWRKLTSDSQLRWIGPEKGVMHLATAAIVNALLDLWARIEDKSVWKLLVDMTPDELVSTMDFRYI
ncbi:hypothetical protein DMN91_007444 [Ooceraea biroi]|uniref:Uncharacterized protein n=1 Tax=Ooceraea biroi TaxID=2015173 RepID=A0A3L8DK77_OOCBI|nr:hypothetical protein DMN91_007444 [Ooceraea biroi]